MSYKTTKSFDLRLKYCNKMFDNKNDKNTTAKTDNIKTKPTLKPNNYVLPRAPINTKFFKTNRKSTTAEQPKGLGHSQTKNPNFVRRCSTSTTVTDATTVSSINENQRNENMSNVVSYNMPKLCCAAAQTPKKLLTYEYTDQRQLYERYLAPKSFKQWPTNCSATKYDQVAQFQPVICRESHAEMDENLSSLQALQAFRLNNADDCFSQYNQNSQRFRNLCANDFDKNWVNMPTQRSYQGPNEKHNNFKKILTYAARQDFNKLLYNTQVQEGSAQLQHNDLDKTFALRFEEAK